jgi:hypothetical protein
MPNVLARVRQEEIKLDRLSWTSLTVGRAERRRLRRGRPMTELVVRATVVITISTLGSPVYAADAPYSIFRKIEFGRVGDHPTIFLDFPGAGAETGGKVLEDISRFESGRESFTTLPTLSAATLTIEWDIPITMFPQDYPFRSAFMWPIPRGGEDAFRAEIGNIVVGNAADLFSTEPTTWTLDSVDIDFIQRVVEGERGGNVLETAGRFSPRRVPLLRRLISTTTPVAASSANQAVPQNELGATGELMRSYLFARLTSSGARVDWTAVGDLSFVLGSREVLRSDVNALLRSQLRDFGGGDSTIPTGLLSVLHDTERVGDRTLPVHEHPESRWQVSTGASALTIGLVRSELLEMTGAPRPERTAL